MSKPIHISYHALKRLSQRRWTNMTIPNPDHVVTRDARERLKNAAKAVYRAISSSRFVVIPDKIRLEKLLKHGIQMTHYVFSRGCGLFILVEEPHRIVFRTVVPKESKIMQDVTFGGNAHKELLAKVDYFSIPYLLAEDICDKIDHVANGIPMYYKNQLEVIRGDQPLARKRGETKVVQEPGRNQA